MNQTSQMAGVGLFRSRVKTPQWPPFPGSAFYQPQPCTEGIQMPLISRRPMPAISQMGTFSDDSVCVARGWFLLLKPIPYWQHSVLDFLFFQNSFFVHTPPCYSTFKGNVFSWQGRKWSSGPSSASHWLNGLVQTVWHLFVSFYLV